MARHIMDLEGISPFQIPEHIHESVNNAGVGIYLNQSNENQKQSLGELFC